MPRFEILREKPMVGWSLVAVLGLAGLFFLGRAFTRSIGDDALAAEVVVVFEDTGDRVEMNRGWLERELLIRSAAGTLKPEEGLVNPKTSKPTGFPTDRAYWDRLIRSINEARHSAPAPKR